MRFSSIFLKIVYIDVNVVIFSSTFYYEYNITHYYLYKLHNLLIIYFIGNIYYYYDILWRIFVVYDDIL